MFVLLSEGAYAEPLIDPNRRENSYELLRKSLDKDLYDLLRVLSVVSPGYMTEKELCKVPTFRHSPDIFEGVIGKAMNDNLVEELYGDKDAPKGHEIGYAITRKGKITLTSMKEAIRLSRGPVSIFF